MRQIVYGAGFLMVLASLSTAVMADHKCPKSAAVVFPRGSVCSPAAFSCCGRASAGGNRCDRQAVWRCGGSSCSQLSDRHLSVYRERRAGSRGQRHHSFGRSGAATGGILILRARMRRK